MEDKVANFRNHYEECENAVRLYSRHIENGHVLDIGSNVGFFSEAILRNLNYKSVHLFEPSKEYLEYSRKSLSRYDNVYFNNYGLSNREETKTLLKCPDSNLGWNTFLVKDPYQPDSFVERMVKEECVLKELDDYEIEKVDFIKIDVEGFENKVLEGGMKLILRHKPSILIEVGWGTRHPNWSDCEEQYNKLFDAGYKRVAFTEHTEDILFEPTLSDSPS